jgi:hypothetical protein
MLIQEAKEKEETRKLYALLAEYVLHDHRNGETTITPENVSLPSHHRYSSASSDGEGRFTTTNNGLSLCRQERPVTHYVQ